MVKKDTLTGYQLALLIMGFLFGSAAIFTPAASARQDAWLAFLLGWGGGFGLMWLYTRLFVKNPGMNYYEMLKESFGKVIAISIMVLYIGYFIHLAALVLRNFGEYMTVTIFYETPIYFTIGLLIVASAYSVRKGLRVLGRAAELLMPYLFIFIVAISLLLIKEYDIKNMLPFFDMGTWPVLKAAFGVWTFPFGEAVAFVMVFPAFTDTQKLSKIALRSVGIMGFVLLMIVLRDLWTLGPDLIARVTFPPSLSTELIPGVTLDPMIAVNLLIGGWVKITVCMYAAALATAQILNRPNLEPFVLPIAVLCVLTALNIYQNIFEMLGWWKSASYPYVVIFFQVLLPLFVLIVLKIKKGSKK